ncbi:MAG: DUF4147 domain-containing protein [Chloroflexi bacterium]|nr:DUF4147 domain-containing protein [Chloroflexota bacterium]
MNYISRLHSKTLDSHPQHRAIKRILSAALEAADPKSAVRAILKRDENMLIINENIYSLDELSGVYLIAIGKAAPAMASAARDVLGNALKGGIVVSKYPSKDDLGKLNLHLAGHPVPDERSLAAGETILDFLSQRNERDFILFLISGGGSALITAPVADITLADLQSITFHLLSSGARIDEINTLRRALDRVKGGGLAQAAHPAKQVSLIISDVVDSPLEAIASGPTVPNPTKNADALAILVKYDLLNETPSAILAALKANQDNEKEVAKGKTLIIGSNRISAEAARDKANQEGFKAYILTTSLQGEATNKGDELAIRLRTDKERPICIIVGGETTVTLNKATALGGRNQEMALATVEALSGAENVMFITLATDGDDGPTDAAGAVVTGETFERASLLGLDVQTHLRAHNAYLFFSALDDLMMPGPTGTNVNDLIFLFAF